MDADLDTLCTAVYCTADDLLPEPPGNARRRVTDAEVVTLCVAQAIMGIPSDRRFLAVARRRLSDLFPELPAQPGFHKRRQRLSDTIEWLVGIFAAQSPGAEDSVVLLDSTPVECGRSRETAKRSALGDAAAYGYCRSHSRFFWGMRLHLACAPTARRGRRRWLERTDRSARSVSLSSSGPFEVARPSSATRLRRQGVHPGRRGNGCTGPASAAPRRAGLGSPVVVHSPAHRVGLLDLQGPCSPSSATALARSRTCGSASPRACSASPLVCRSTTGSAVRAALSSLMWREGVESVV